MLIFKAQIEAKGGSCSDAGVKLVPKSKMPAKSVRELPDLVISNGYIRIADNLWGRLCRLFA
jgi:hypothetical protein